MDGLPPDTDEYMAAATDYGDIPGAFAPPTMDPPPMPMPDPSAPRVLPPAPRALPPAPAYAPPPRPAPPALADVDPFQIPVAPPRFSLPQLPVIVDSELQTQGKMLGFSTIATAIGMLVGVRLGGGYGAVAGSLFAGSAVNAYRASIYAARGNEAGRKEAVLSGTYAVLAAGLGGAVLWYTRGERASSAMKPNRDDRCGRSSLTSNSARSCGIRAIV